MMMVLKFKTLDTRLTPNAKEETRSPVFFFFFFPPQKGHSAQDKSSHNTTAAQ